MAFAALSTVFTVFEVIVASAMEMFNWSRKKACIINCVALIILSLPCALGFNLLQDIKPFGEGSTIMDLEDFLFSNIILPLGALIIVIFCVSKKGWGFNNFIEEANTGKGIKFKKYLRGYVTYILPIIIIAVFIIGIYNFFK